MSADVELLVLLERLRPPWHARGRCRGGDTDAFFPTRGESVDSARRVCGGCEVRLECLNYAMEHGISHGVWGGTSARSAAGSDGRRGPRARPSWR